MTISFFKTMTCIAILALLFVVGLACDGGSPVSSKADSQVSQDYGKTIWPDYGSQPDVQQSVPDGTTSSNSDSTTTESDSNVGYKGAAFGCQMDSDCFGQKCCPTPWGVKLCAPTCGK
jgi:hypothetical protein